MDISLEKICFLIVKARELDVKVPPIAPDDGSNESDDKDISILEDRADDMTYAEVQGFFETLNEDEELDLVTLMWIGRGNYNPDDWQEAREMAAQEAINETSEYLLGTPLLADHLENGLNAMGRTCESEEMGRM